MAPIATLKLRSAARRFIVRRPATVVTGLHCIVTQGLCTGHWVLVLIFVECTYDEFLFEHLNVT
jgi:hypothetical protein